MKHLTSVLTKFYNRILKSKEIPTDWKTSDIILMFKKGKKHKIENYRTITLSSTPSKIFSKLIEQIIRPHPGKINLKNKQISDENFPR